MITPVKSYSFLFTADNVSSALTLDITLLPIAENIRTNPVGLQLPVVTSTPTGPIAGVTAALLGTVVTFTFPAPPAKNDTNGNLIVYTATFYLQY